MTTVEELQYEKTLVSDSQPPATCVKGFVMQSHPYLALVAWWPFNLVNFHFPTAAYKPPKFLGSRLELPSVLPHTTTRPVHLVNNVFLRLCPSTLLPYLFNTIGYGFSFSKFARGYFCLPLGVYTIASNVSLSNVLFCKCKSPFCYFRCMGSTLSYRDLHESLLLLDTPRHDLLT